MGSQEGTLYVCVYTTDLSYSMQCEFSVINYSD